MRKNQRSSYTLLAFYEAILKRLNVKNSYNLKRQMDNKILQP